MNKEIIWMDENSSGRFYPNVGIPIKGQRFMVDEITAARLVKDKLASFPKKKAKELKKEVD